MITKAQNALRIAWMLLFGSLATLSAGAQEPAVSPPAGFPPVREGTVEVAPLAKSPLNETMRSMLLARRSAQRSQGWALASEEQAQAVDGYFDDAQVTRRLKPTLLDLQANLQVVPAQLEGTLLGAAQIEGVLAAGGFVNGRWTGVARAMTMRDLGRIVLEEYDYRAAGSHIVIAEEAVDSELNGYPVLYNVWRTPSGKTWTEIRWFTSNKEFRLYLGKAIQKSDPLYKQVRQLMSVLS